MKNKALELFGQRVRELRNQSGLSQEKFALKIGMDRTYFASVESGRRNISLLNILKIAEGLSIKPSELFDYDSKKERMKMDNNYRNLIAQEFRSCVNGTIDRVTNNTPTYRPFHTALLSDEVIFWSAFERSFSTSFGQRVIEQITKLVALSNGAECADRQVETVINIDKAYEEAIHDHVQSLRSSHRGAVRSWESIVNEIRHVQPIGESKKLRIISDVWWRKMELIIISA